MKSLELEVSRVREEREEEKKVVREDQEERGRRERVRYTEERRRLETVHDELEEERRRREELETKERREEKEKEKGLELGARLRELTLQLGLANKRVRAEIEMFARTKNASGTLQFKIVTKFLFFLLFSSPG